MSGASSDFDPQELWQARPRSHPAVTLGEIHRRALRFQKQARRRQIEGWGCMAFMLLCYGTLWYAWRTGANWMVLVGSFLCLSGGILAGWRWTRFNSAEPLPDEGKTLVEAYRRNLIRLRDSRRNVFLQIYLPLIPGAALAWSGRLFTHNTLGLSDATDHLIAVLVLVLCGLAFLAGWLWNQHQADKLQRKLDDL